MKEKITNTAEFRRWVRLQVVSQEISMAELARQMEIPQARISDAIPVSYTHLELKGERRWELGDLGRNKNAV